MAIITTSRGASDETMELAKNLSLLLPGSRLERRGKASIDKLVTLARKKGHSRIIIIKETDRHPSTIEFLALDETDWHWTDTVIPITRTDTHTIEKAETLEAEPTLEQLFEFESSAGGNTLKKKGNTLLFSRGKQKLLEITS